MKKLFASIFIFLFCIINYISCTSYFSNYNSPNNYFDEYKRLNTKAFKQSYYPQEKLSAIQYLEMELLYHKTEADDTLKLFLNIKRKHPSQEIEKNIYFKTEGKSIAIMPLKQVSSVFHKESFLEKSSASVTDTSGKVSTTESTNSIEQNWIGDNFYVNISDDLVTKIDESNEFSFRLYSGAIPSTFVLKGSNLAKFKEFINRLEE